MKSIDFKNLLIGILGTALELDEQFQLDAFCFSDRIIFFQRKNMPIYSYHCEQCQTEFTELRRCSEMDAPIDCPECGNRESQRKLSGFAVGSGASSTTTLGKPSNSPFR